MDCEYFQSILVEFDTDKALEKTYFIRFFRKDLKPSRKAHTEQKKQELHTWKEVIEKAVEVEIKTALQSIFYTQKTDHQCEQGVYQVYVRIIKVQI